MPQKDDPLSKLEQAVYKKRPVLAELIEKFGDQSLAEYTRQYLDLNLPSGEVFKKRKIELLATVNNQAKRLFGKEAAEEIVRQMNKLFLVSTSDHHGPVTHPFFVNSNLALSIPIIKSDDPDLTKIIVFSFGNVSLNNSSYPRGLVFNSTVEDKVNFIKVPFFPDKLKMGTILAMRPFTAEDLNRAKSTLDRKLQQRELTKGIRKKVARLVDEVLADPEVLAAKSYSDQVSFINQALWSRMFERLEKVPDLIYLQIEDLVGELLEKYHFNNPDSPLYRLIFSAESEELMAKYFDGIEGSYSKDGYGTYLFWGIEPKKSRKVRLQKKGNCLVSGDGKIEVELTPEAIVEASRAKKICPGMLIDYCLIALYYGLNCVGGFSQVTYLEQMRKGWLAMAKDLGFENEAEICGPVKTKMINDGLTLAYQKSPAGCIYPASGVDLIIDHELNLPKWLFEVADKVKFSQLIRPTLPEIYRVVYAESEREEDLLACRPEAIAKEQGLEEALVLKSD